VAKSQDGIRVVIYDQEYHMRGELDPEYIRQLAEFVDAKMRSIAARTHTVDSLRAAILAALNIADEYHQLKSKHEATAKHLDQKVEQFSQRLNQLLVELDPPGSRIADSSFRIQDSGAGN
jgi:cell division protein ZapA